MATATLAKPATPPTADARLDNHAGPNRGILIAPYRDRAAQVARRAVRGPGLRPVLRVPRRGAAWWTTAVTSGPTPTSAGTASTTRDRGQRNRRHGHRRGRRRARATRPAPSATSGSTARRSRSAARPRRQRLVNFAPNVDPQRGPALHSRRRRRARSGSCTLTCHGKNHVNYGYLARPSAERRVRRPASRDRTALYRAIQAPSLVPPPSGPARSRPKCAPRRMGRGVLSRTIPSGVRPRPLRPRMRDPTWFATPARGRRCARPRGGLG